MLPIKVKFGWVFLMISHWVPSGSDLVQHFIGNLNDGWLSPSLVSSVNLLRAHSVPLSRLLTKTLNSTGTGTGPWGTSVAASCQLDFVPLITTLWAQQSSQVSTRYILYLFKPYLIDLAIRILWETISKTFQKAMWTPSSDQPTELANSSQKTVRLFRHSLAFVNPSWLFPNTFLFFICLDVTSRRVWYTAFPKTEVRLIALPEDGCDISHFWIMRNILQSLLQNTQNVR